MTWPARRKNYTWVKRKRGDLLLAHGRDPYFPGWPDTLQLNYANPATQEAMIGELMKIAGQCDGVRCDMAMLVLPDVFERTWGQRAPLFWPTATQRVREHVPGFLFMAEVYWDLEWTLQQQGFDYAYDKRLYDRLRDHHARPVREHFHAGLDYQNKLARFLENHDEPRAAATFPTEFTRPPPSSRFCRRGCVSFIKANSKAARSGFRRILSRPRTNRSIRSCVTSTTGCWPSCVSQRPRRPMAIAGMHTAWDGNWTNDCFVAFAWQGHDGERLLVAVNYAPNQSQCHVRLPFADLGGIAMASGGSNRRGCL